MIVVDASAVPDFPSGVRTRLRGLYGAYSRLSHVPAVRLITARGSSLFDGVSLGPAVSRLDVPYPGGPVRRALRLVPARAEAQRGASLWHSETIPPLAPRGARRLLTLHDLRHLEARLQAGGTPWGHALRRAASRRWLPGLARRLDGVVTVSAATRAEIHQRLGVPHRRIFLVPNALGDATEVPTEAEVDRVHRSLGLDPPYLLSVGHLERRKGLDLVLTALAAQGVDDALGHVTWAVVGEGPDRARLERMARDLGVETRVRFLGRRSDDEVRVLTSRCVALAFPSQIEGFGFPVFEALQQGCPVLASPLPCLEEVRDEGLVRVARDAGLWARKIAWALHHREGLRRVRPEIPPALGWSDAARALSEVYRTVLGPGR